MWLPNKEIADAIMLMVANHQDSLVDQRMEPIGDNCFES
jgi:hypothetical protein